MPEQNLGKRAAELHRRAIVIDGHSDILMPIADGKVRLGERVTVPDPATWEPPLGITGNARGVVTDFSPHTYYFGPIGQYSIPQFLSGGLTVQLERNNVFFGPGSDCLYILDHRTGERRRGTLDDVVAASRVCDALPNIDFLMSFCIADDLDQETADRHQMRAMLMNSAKPILFVTTEFEGCVDVVKMAEIVAGGEEELRRNPLCACYMNVTGPLRHNAEALQKLLFLAGKGLPTTYAPVVLRGASGPVTASGAIALANAGELAGLVLAQLKREGAPVILTGGVNDMLDMRAMADVYAAPENRVMLVELAHYYGLPIFGLAGASDAKLPDEQAAAEAAFSLLLEALAGAQMIHDVGYLEGGKCNSLEQLVICDELINYVRRFMQGLEISDETLALDVIDEVGPHGDFLSTRHTYDHFKEDWYPALFDRSDFESWVVAGNKMLRQGTGRGDSGRAPAGAAASRRPERN